jgi:hypothetical protein
MNTGKRKFMKEKEELEKNRQTSCLGGCPRLVLSRQEGKFNTGTSTS